MKVQGWRAVLAGGALIFGTAAWADGTQKEQGASLEDSQEQMQQEGLGGSGQSGQQESWEESEGTGGSGQTGGGQQGQQGRMGQQQQPGQMGQQPSQQPSQQMGQQTGQQSGQQQASLTGEVVETKKDVVFLRLDQGAIVPVKVNQQTQAQSPKDQKELKGQQALKHVKPGDKLTLEVQKKGNENIAQSIQFDESSQQQQEIQGTIASVQGNWINLEHEGALVPLKVDKKTQFQSQGQQQVTSAKQLKAGDEVRASFRAEGTVNNAESIQVTSQGTGGAGEEGQFEQQPEPLPMEEPQPMEEPLFEEPGTGGAGESGAIEMEEPQPQFEEPDDSELQQPQEPGLDPQY